MGIIYHQIAMDKYYEMRLEKRKNWQEKMGFLYPNKFFKSHSAVQLNKEAEGSVSFAGRIMTIRKMGKIAFMDVKDDTGIMQLSFIRDDIGLDDFKFYLNNLDIGDIIGVLGEVRLSQLKQKVLKIESCVLLSKALRIIPNSYKKINSSEFRTRQRYLDLLVNDNTWNVFEMRSKLVKYIRNYLENQNFMEVETPVLQPVATGASAKPFVTHHNVMDISLYLRIGHEPYLKRLMVGGYEKIFEIGKCFRNEGIDASRLQEFTLLEYYAAYWNYKDNMIFVQDMIRSAVEFLTGKTCVTYQGINIDFSGKWQEVTFRELLRNYLNIDIDMITTFDDLVEEIIHRNIDVEYQNYVTYSALLDVLYKKFCRIHIIQPTFVTEYPTELVCLSRKCDDKPERLELFQLVVNSWELIKAYSELVDPIEQRERFEEQNKMREAGDEVAMAADEEYVICMEYGMPIMSGAGLGIDRLLGIICDITNIRDTIYFPPVRPLKRSEVDAEKKR